MFQIGSAKVLATQPHIPCYKLGVKFGKMDIVKKFLESGKSEIYFKVVKKGKIGTTDDSLHLIKKDNNDVPIENTVEIVTEDKNNKLLIEKVKFKTYHSCCKHYFLEKLSHLNKIKNCT
jgi:MOSC domain-containing protein YiiM